MKPVILWTDTLVYILIFIFICFLLFIRRSESLKDAYRQVLAQPKNIIVICILSFYCFVGILDTLHFKMELNDTGVKSVLDLLLSPYDTVSEKTYSAPFATHGYNSEIVKNENGTFSQVYPRLLYGGNHLTDLNIKYWDILKRAGIGLLIGLLFSGILYKLVMFWGSNFYFFKLKKVKWTFWITVTTIICLISIVSLWMFKYHVLGTDKIGRDVLYISLKSIRTGLVIGTLTTLIMLPFALFLGMWAGYFRGFIDDIIQYIYTTLNSIPGILLIAAAILSLQVKIEQDADLRLLLLCIILGITSWTTLCRLLRGETLKLREAEYVQAAFALGVKHLKIIHRHILPNLMHIVIISVVLDFSGLVLAEAVLSYVGVGVDPSTYSWGNMINGARLEMAREPMVWWSLLGAFLMMFILVFCANVLSDAVQKVLDPRAR